MDNTPIPSKTPDPFSRTPPSPSKNRTCPGWASGTCPKTATSCSHAHHLFPHIIYRSGKEPDKDYPCPDGQECYWPPETCAFMHDDDDFEFNGRDSTNFQRDPEKRRMEVESLLSAQKWGADVRFYCKREGCVASGFEELEGLLRHQRTPGACPLENAEGKLMEAVAQAEAQVLGSQAVGITDAKEEKALDTEAIKPSQPKQGAAISTGQTHASMESRPASPPQSRTQFPKYSQGPSGAKMEEMVSRDSWRRGQ